MTVLHHVHLTWMMLTVIFKTKYEQTAQQI